MTRNGRKSSSISLSEGNFHFAAILWLKMNQTINASTLEQSARTDLRPGFGKTSEALEQT
jgi:hypothetical protein